MLFYKPTDYSLKKELIQEDAMRKNTWKVLNSEPAMIYRLHDESKPDRPENRELRSRYFGDRDEALAYAAELNGRKRKIPKILIVIIGVIAVLAFAWSADKTLRLYFEYILSLGQYVK